MISSGMSARQPRYLLIARSLVNDIANGVYPVGTTLPGELELCQHFGVSRFTIRGAIRSLREMGLVTPQQGVGTVVKSKTAESRYTQSMATLTDLAHFAEETILSVLESEKISATPPLSGFLKCKEGEVWLNIRGVRFVASQGDPICHSSIYVPSAYMGIQEMIGTTKVPIYRLIEEHYGENIIEVQQEISAVALPESVARLLKAKPGSPALKLTRHYLGEGDRLLEVAVNLHPSERFSYSMSLHRQWQSLEE